MNLKVKNFFKIYYLPYLIENMPIIKLLRKFIKNRYFCMY